VSDAQLAPGGGGNTEARKHKGGGGRCNTRSTFKTSRCNTYNIYLKADETLEICISNTCKNI
jgi:hypothetical protein